MISVEKVGRTVEMAIEEALTELGVNKDEVDIEILEEGSKGLFGILGNRSAKVRVTLKKDFVDADEDEVNLIRRHRKPQDITPQLTKARDFLLKVTSLLGLDSGVESRETEDGIVFMNITGENLGIAIGKHGQTLDAIQYLTNIIANEDEKGRVRFVIDAEGYRTRREDYIKDLAVRMSEQAKRKKRKIMLDPMSAMERRLVHVALQDDPSVETYSEGQEPHRRVVIVPKR
jgi:spoIIIJ-associated protein